MWFIISFIQNIICRRSPNDRLGSVEHDMNRYNGLPKPYSMMNLGTTDGDAQPPKMRSSSRKKKEVFK